MITDYHARYFAHELTRRRAADGIGRLSQSLFDACVDLNPHQIEAAMFALRSPLDSGVILADEVGLGKTIEAGVLLCQHWAERRRNLIVVCPASLRRQWAAELEEKFNLPALVLDSRTLAEADGKLLASSHAIAGTLGTVIRRLEAMHDGTPSPMALIETLADAKDLDGDYLDEPVEDDPADDRLSNDATPASRNGISHCFKMIRLESYEDALDNLKLKRSAVQEDFLNRLEAGSGAGSGRMHPMKVEYLLSRMLETEAAGGSLLDFDRFADPTGYTLTVTRDGKPREVRVDLLETLNYLIGLTVRYVEAPLRFRAAFERLPSGRLVVARRGLRQDAAGPWWFRTVEGTLPDGEKALIVWRTLTGDMEQDNAVLDAFVNRIALKTRDAEYDTIWVNGNNNLQNLRLTPDGGDEGEGGEAPTSDDTLDTPAQWKVRLIEDDFHRLMFAEGEG